MADRVTFGPHSAHRDGGPGCRRGKAFRSSPGGVGGKRADDLRRPPPFGRAPGRVSV